jgi:hypothetical protein
MSLSADVLWLLHDHYKETFSLIRTREMQRDRLFLWVIAIFILLMVEVQYPANFHGVLVHIHVGGNDLDLQQLPLARLLDISWLFTAALVLKYCQVSRAVERQYDYLHTLEDRMAMNLGDDALYRREGRAYLTNYPLLLMWAWVSYTILFPTALATGVVYLLAVEWTRLKGSVWAKGFDIVFGLSILITVGLYRIRRWPRSSGP